VDGMPIQEEIVTELKRIFGDSNVKLEWDVAKDSKDDYTRKLYCPRIDVAVGPFNIDRNISLNNRRITEAYEKHRTLIERIKSMSDVPNQSMLLNENPRCLLAIELENKSSRKHRLGSMVNASAMGKIGIILAANPSVFRSIVKIREYLKFIESVGKARYNPGNLIIVLVDDFLDILKKYR